MIDYGQTIKDLAATNIFPGDMLLKNFGVTRHGRVVFYDYDELCLLTDCNFREMPAGARLRRGRVRRALVLGGRERRLPRGAATFLGLPPDLRAIFIADHGELFGVDVLGRRCRRRHAAGEVIDIFPYKEGRRLARAPA